MSDSKETPARHTIIGSIIADRYRIREPIGAGGAGNVYRAVQIQLNREVAVKVVRTDVEKGVRKELGARFRREAAMAAKLSHPNIVTVHDFGLTELGLQYVVMELLKGRTLKKAMKSGPLSSEETARIGLRLAMGLRHAHSRGLIHRDVKATNVLLVEDDEGIEQPMLLDFGLVKSVDCDLEMTGQSAYLGTPLYMSPEQTRRGANVDHRTDIYALGCMMYGMVAGVMPYRGDGAMATAMKHLEEPYPPIAKRAPEVDADPRLEWIIRRCMEKAPEDRYQDTDELVIALEGWLTEDVSDGGMPGRAWVVPFVGGAGILGTLGLVAGFLGIVALLVAVVSVLGEQTVAERNADSLAEDSISDIVLGGHVVLDKEEPDEPAPKATPKEEKPEERVVLKVPPVSQGKPEPVRKKKPKPPPSVDEEISEVQDDGSDGEKEESLADTFESKPEQQAGEQPSENTSEVITVDGVAFDSLRAARALKWLNESTWKEMNAAGVYPKGCSIIANNRPFTSLAEVGALRGIGEKTMISIANASAP